MANIFLFLPTLQAGGTEKQVFYLARELARSGHRVTVGVFYAGGYNWEELKKEPVVLHSFNRRGRFDFFAFERDLRQFLKRNSFDVVQAFLPVANYFGLRAAHKAGLRNLYAGIRSSCVDFRHYGLGSKLYFDLSRKVINKYARKVVYNSFKGKECHLNKGFKSEATVIWNAIDFAQAQAATEKVDRNNKLLELNIPEGSSIISTIARIDPLKDFYTLLKAFKLLTADSSSDMYLLIIGDGWDKIKNKIINLSRSLKIDRYVRLVGFRRDVYELISCSNVLVCSSLTEGLSNTVMEAMCAGLPIVSTNVGDHGMVLEKNRAILVPVKDAWAMRGAVSSILSDRKLADQLTRNAREFAKDNFSLSKMTSSYLRTWGIG